MESRVRKDPPDIQLLTTLQQETDAPLRDDIKMSRISPGRWDRMGVGSGRRRGRPRKRCGHMTQPEKMPPAGQKICTSVLVREFLNSSKASTSRSQRTSCTNRGACCSVGMFSKLSHRIRPQHSGQIMGLGCLAEKRLLRA